MEQEYVHRPRPVWAVQVKDVTNNAWKDYPDWLQKALMVTYPGYRSLCFFGEEDGDMCFVHPTSGLMLLRPEDYILCKDSGGITVRREDMFNLVYEKVE